MKMGNCPKSQEKQAGLCYTPCEEGYTGVGPLCWRNCPSDFTDTGTGCTKPTYTRGAGTIPTGCPEGQENDAGLCYPKCREGYKGVGPVCWGVCPSGFTDIGAFCQKPAAYGRGAGFVSEELCRNSNDHGAKTNGCEKYGLLWYPKCDPNYHAVGCCICSPNCPAGWTDTGTGCTKPSYGRGVGTVPSQCPEGQENQAGLCYEKCKENYTGAGPVCWGDCPPGMTDIGAFCQKDTIDRGAGTIPPISIPWWLWAIPLIIVLLLIGGFIVRVIFSNRKPPPAVVNISQAPELRPLL